MGDIIRRRICFYGWVQGVGFRYRARHAASLYSVTGWVRNESDGTVTMEIQGTETQIDQVLQAIRRGRYIQIDGMQTTCLPVAPEERGFITR